MPQNIRSAYVPRLFRCNFFEVSLNPKSRHIFVVCILIYDFFRIFRMFINKENGRQGDEFKETEKCKI